MRKPSTPRVDDTHPEPIAPRFCATLFETCVSKRLVRCESFIYFLMPRGYAHVVERPGADELLLEAWERMHFGGARVVGALLAMDSNIHVLNVSAIRKG